MPDRKRISRAFIRNVSHIALFAVLGFASSPSKAQQASLFSSPLKSPVSLAPKVVAPVELASKDKLYTEFTETKLGRDLLDFAKKNDIRIVYDERLVAERSAGAYSFEEKTVSLQTGMTIDDQIITLAHELRHAWQHINIATTPRSVVLMTPEQRWTLARYSEADAFAFSTYFMIERIHNAETPIIAPKSEIELTIATALSDEAETDDGLTLSAYRRIAFEYFLTDLSISSDYTETHLSWCENVAEHALMKIAKVKTELESKDLTAADKDLSDLIQNVTTKPASINFESILRQFGGVSANPADKTCLQDKRISLYTLTADYPFRYYQAEQKDDFMKKLRTSFKENADRYTQIRKQLESLTKEVRARHAEPSGPKL